MGCYIARHSKRMQTGEPVDMKGGSCAVRYVTKNTMGNNQFVWYYANCTGVIDMAKNRYYITNIFWLTYGLEKTQEVYFDSEHIEKEMYVIADLYEKVEIFGDWVYSDGTNATTNDPIIVPAKFDCIICK